MFTSISVRGGDGFVYSGIEVYIEEGGWEMGLKFNWYLGLCRKIFRFSFC